MMDRASQEDDAHGFEFLTEPVLVLSLAGDILSTNAAARMMFGNNLAIGRLTALMTGDFGRCLAYLRLASGSTAPRPGKFEFLTMQGAAHCKTQAARSRQTSAPTCVILHLSAATSDRFTILDRRVRDLDAKLHQRLMENAALQDALGQNQTLLRELQHRVKNNIQQMLTLIKLSSRGHTSPDVSAVVRSAHGRLSAMAAAQEAIYQTNAFGAVPAQDVLRRIVLAAARMHGVSDAISVVLDEVCLTREEAHCLAMIANELVTNAARHGAQKTGGTIAVTFSDDGTTCRLDVCDAGPGLPDLASYRASGLTLVRNLCRQIGGRLDIVSNSDGARCTVHFRPESHKGNTT